jgi:hypothetical protein
LGYFKGCALGQTRTNEVFGRDNYNFCRIHQTMRVTPAMAAGISDHVWSLEEVAALLDLKRVTTDFLVVVQFEKRQGE